MVAAALTKDGHLVEVATTGDEALHLLRITAYEVVILDWTLPDMEGPDILKEFRRKNSVPVLMLTGKGAIANRTTGLDAGADDYLIKPFSTSELAARIRALLRRPQSFTGTKLTVGPWLLDRSALSVC